MREEKYRLELDEHEQSALIGTLNERRNDLIRQSRPTDVVDELILKAAKAPKKREKCREAR